MQTKLTIRMEKDLIEAAKEWAAKNDISLSQAVAMFFHNVTEPKKNEVENLHPFARKLLDIARKRKGPTLTDKEARREYHERVAGKHR